MTEDDFKAEVTTSDEELSDEDKAADRPVRGQLPRARPDRGRRRPVQKSENDIQGGGTLAYYSPEDKKVRVRGTELDVATKVTLAHELTHALQDQYYDLTRLQNMKTDGEATAFRALVEGDATVVENAYIDQLSSADAAAYDDQNAEAGRHRGLRQRPPGAGGHASPRRTSSARRSWRRSRPRAATTPSTTRCRTLRPARPRCSTSSPSSTHQVPVTGRRARRSPTATTKVDDGDFGATTWYLMLAQRIDVHRAIKAVDGWAGDSLPHLHRGRRAGLRQGPLPGQDRRPTPTACTTDLKDWLVGRPQAGARASTPTGSYVELTSCDPGESATLEGQRPVDGGHPAARPAAAGRQRGVQGRRAGPARRVLVERAGRPARPGRPRPGGRPGRGRARRCRPR